LFNIIAYVYVYSQYVSQDAYNAGTKKQKMDISKAIVEAVYSMDPPGRFLKQCPETGQWNELSKRDAADRAAQAMAYAIRSKDISKRRKEERRRSRRISQRQKSKDGNGNGNGVVAASLQLHHADRMPTQHQHHLNSSNNQLELEEGNPSSSSLSSTPRHRLASRGPTATIESSEKKIGCTGSLADEMPRVPGNSNANNNLYQQLQLLPQLHQNSTDSTNTLPPSFINQNANQNGLIHILAQAVQQQLLQSDLGQNLLGQLLHAQTAVQPASLEAGWVAPQQLLAQAQQQQQQLIQQQQQQQQLILLRHLLNLNQQNVLPLPSVSLPSILSSSAASSASQGLLPPNGLVPNGNGALSSYSSTPHSQPAAHGNALQNVHQQLNPSSDALLLSSLLSNLQHHPNSVGIISAPQAQGAQQLDPLQRSLVLQHAQQLLASSLNSTPANQQIFGQQQQQQQQSQLLDPHHQARQAALLLQVQNSQDPPSINPQPLGNAAPSLTRREESDVDEGQSVSEKKQA
jgi:hypothetical protein